jgi:hypothetical protein
VNVNALTVRIHPLLPAVKKKFTKTSKIVLFPAESSVYGATKYSGTGSAKPAAPVLPAAGK